MKRKRNNKPLTPHGLMIGLIDIEHRLGRPVNMRKVKRLFRQRAHRIPGMLDKIITEFMGVYS